MVEKLGIIGTIIGFILYLYKEGVYQLVKKLIKEVQELIKEAKDLIDKFEEYKKDGFTEEEITELFTELKQVIDELQDVIVVTNKIWVIIKKKKEAKWKIEQLRKQIKG